MLSQPSARADFIALRLLGGRVARTRKVYIFVHVLGLQKIFLDPDGLTSQITFSGPPFATAASGRFDAPAGDHTKADAEVAARLT